MTSYAQACCRVLMNEMAPQPEPRTTTVLRPVPTVGGTCAVPTDGGGAATAARVGTAVRRVVLVLGPEVVRERGEAPPRKARAGSAAAAAMASVSPADRLRVGVELAWQRSRKWQGETRRRRWVFEILPRKPRRAQAAGLGEAPRVILSRSTNGDSQTHVRALFLLARKTSKT